MNTIVKLGLAALAVGTFSTLPSKAEIPDPSNPFTGHGLPIPGAYFKTKENQQPTTVAFSKSGKGIGEQKQTTSKAGK
jgi:hypothetical protein